MRRPAAYARATIPGDATLRAPGVLGPPVDRRGTLSSRGARPDVAARRSGDVADCRRHRRHLVQLLDPAVDERPAVAGARRAGQRTVPLLGRHHLLSGSADARVLRASDAADAPGASRPR